MNLKMDSRFKGIEPFKDKVQLSSPTMHGEELRYMTEAYESNWMSTVGENINELERLVSEYIGQWRNKMQWYLDDLPVFAEVVIEAIRWHLQIEKHS